MGQFGFGVRSFDVVAGDSVANDSMLFVVAVEIDVAAAVFGVGSETAVVAAADFHERLLSKLRLVIVQVVAIYSHHSH